MQAQAQERGLRMLQTQAQGPAHAVWSQARALNATAACAGLEVFRLEKHSQHLFACVEDSMSVITTRKPMLSCRDSVGGMDRCQVSPFLQESRGHPRLRHLKMPLSQRGVTVICITFHRDLLNLQPGTLNMRSLNVWLVKFLVPIVGRWPRLKTLWETPLMNGPGLEVESSSLVEAYSVILWSSTCRSHDHIVALCWHFLAKISNDTFLMLCSNATPRPCP
jgi:hypothetical protein